MRFFSTLIMGIKYLWRDPVIVTVVVIFPIAIILVLGTALDNMFNPEFGFNFDPPRVAVVTEVNSPLATFVGDDHIQQFLDVEFTDLYDAEKLLTDGYITAAFVDQGLGQPILVLLPALQDPLSMIALTIIDSFQQVGAVVTLSIMQEGNIVDLVGTNIEITSQPLGTRVPRAIDYYAVTMLIMILLYTGLNGMELFHKGMYTDTGVRMQLSPISKSSLVGGLLAASTLTSFFQGMITFAFTAFVYGVYWGDRIPIVLLTLFGMVLFSQALCILLIIIFENRNVVAGITQLLFMITTFVSGGFVPVNLGNLDRIFRFVPNALAHTVVFGSIYGGDEVWMMASLAILFAIAMILVVISFILGRKRFV